MKKIFFGKSKQEKGQKEKNSQETPIVIYSHKSIECSDESVMKQVMEWTPEHNYEICVIDGSKEQIYSLQKSDDNSEGYYPIFQHSEIKNEDTGKCMHVNYPTPKSIWNTNMYFKMSSDTYMVLISFNEITVHERNNDFENYFFALKENYNPIEIYKKAQEMFPPKITDNNSGCTITIQQKEKETRYTFTGNKIMECYVQEKNEKFNVNLKGSWKYCCEKCKIEVTHVMTSNHYLWNIENFSSSTNSISEEIAKVENKISKIFNKLTALQEELNTK